MVLLHGQVQRRKFKMSLFLTETLHLIRSLWCPEMLQSNQLRSMVLSGIPHCLRGKRIVLLNRKFMMSLFRILVANFYWFCA